jgi:hypothetical protein
MRNRAGGRSVGWELADASSLAYQRKTAIAVVSYTRGPKVGLAVRSNQYSAAGEVTGDPQFLHSNHQSSRGMNSLNGRASLRTCPVGCICPQYVCGVMGA